MSQNTYVKIKFVDAAHAALREQVHEEIRKIYDEYHLRKSALSFSDLAEEVTREKEDRDYQILFSNIKDAELVAQELRGRFKDSLDVKVQ